MTISQFLWDEANGITEIEKGKFSYNKRLSLIHTGTISIYSRVHTLGLSN